MTFPNQAAIRLLAWIVILAAPLHSVAQVKEVSEGGFLISISRTVDLSAADAYAAFVDDFSEWYDASHSYTGKGENLSLDLREHCMLERLPDGGFVRHMEVVFHQPGKMLRMTGGLGPLQGMGVAGAMTFSFSENEGQTTISMSYSVSGGHHLKLDKLAGPVNSVLNLQLDGLQKHCNQSGKQS